MLHAHSIHHAEIPTRRFSITEASRAFSTPSLFASPGRSLNAHTNNDVLARLIHAGYDGGAVIAHLRAALEYQSLVSEPIDIRELTREFLTEFQLQVGGNSGPGDPDV